MKKTGNILKFFLGAAMAASLLAAPLPAQEAEPDDPAPSEAAPGEPAAPAFNQGAVPEALRQPQRGDESPRYPWDAVIGELGRGLAAEEAYRYARNLLQGALSLNRESALLAGARPSQLEELFAGIAPLNPQQYRLGGGREEADGATSFLFRFIGRDMSLAGELYLRQADGTWQLEDIIVEEARPISDRGNTYQFDFSPYERFF
jgi:hypothetical protein